MFRNAPRLRQALTPLALAVVSLLAALALWVAVTDAEHPTTDQEFAAAIPLTAINVPDGLAVRSITPNAVRVSVRSTQDDFERLSQANFRAIVDMTGIREGETDRIVLVEMVGVDDVDVIEVSAATVRVTLETSATKQVPVLVNRIGTQASGFYVSDVEASPAQVTVTGAASLIALVESAAAEVNLTGVRSNVQQQLTLSARDGTGADVRRITITPSTIDVRMTIQQQDSSIVLPVVPRTQGAIATGFHVTGIQIDPSTVVIHGLQEQIQGLDLVDTEPIDIEGARETLTQEIQLQVPDGLTASREIVTVTVHIEAATGERILTVAPIVENVPEGLNVTILTTAINVRVRGGIPILNNIGPSTARAVINATGLEPGEHTLEVSVTLPVELNIQILSVEPGRAVIALQP